MDVDRRSFHWQLPRMLRALAKAHFVGIDFELSGIQSRTTHRPFDDGHSTGGNKQTLQERYREAKEAAERYQILQVGMTVVQQDLETAVEFLMSHGFNMEAPFTKGVPYLSREEEQTAINLELSRQNKSEIADILLRPDETESIQFVRKVRADIEKWDRHKHPPQDFLNIGPEGRSIIQYTDTRGLNRYQKRLVHQLVRAEFPGLVSISRGTFIQIIPLDKEREENLQKARMKAFDEKLARQVGLRWIVEAMVGGNLDNIDPISFASCGDSNPVWLDGRELNREFNEIKSRLHQTRTVLVGHNVFMDLINLYKCFFGALPDTVEEFQCIMHELFPLIIDTKYMATHNNTDLNARSGLDELYADSQRQTIPSIALHKDHCKYHDMAVAHEAGYDAFITAKILIRLSAKLEAHGLYIDSDDEGWHTPGEDGSVLSSRSNGVSVTARVPIPVEDPFITKRKKNTEVVRENTLFSHAGRFDLLHESTGDTEEEDEADDEAESHFEDVHAENLRDNGRVGAPAIDEWSTMTSAPRKVAANTEKAPSRLMPPWDSDFWNVYGNKLRVNGTVEGVCHLVGI